jgi:hypothetical protein
MDYFYSQQMPLRVNVKFVILWGNLQLQQYLKKGIFHLRLGELENLQQLHA